MGCRTVSCLLGRLRMRRGPASEPGRDSARRQSRPRPLADALCPGHVSSGRSLQEQLRDEAGGGGGGRGWWGWVSWRHQGLDNGGGGGHTGTTCVLRFVPPLVSLSRASVFC